MLLHVAIETIGGPEDKKRELNRATSLGLKVALEDWHRTTLLDHFKTGAGRRYGYQKRKKGYMIQKGKKKGHQRPLVWSGSLRAELMRAIQVTALKSSSGASGKMWGRALRLSGRKNMPDMKSEVKAVVQKEIDRMAVIARRVASKYLNSIQTRRRKKVV